MQKYVIERITETENQHTAVMVNQRFPFLKTVTQLPAIISTTAYHQYAVEGFNLNVTDYLLKPFEFERFLIAVNKVKTAQGEKQKSNVSREIKDFIFLTVQRKKMKILFSEILYIECQRK